MIKLPDGYEIKKKKNPEWEYPKSPKACFISLC